MNPSLLPLRFSVFTRAEPVADVEQQRGAEHDRIADLDVRVLVAARRRRVVERRGAERPRRHDLGVGDAAAAVDRVVLQPEIDAIVRAVPAYGLRRRRLEVVRVEDVFRRAVWQRVIAVHPYRVRIGVRDDGVRELGAAVEIRVDLRDVERVEDARRHGIPVLVADEGLAEVADALQRRRHRQQRGRLLVVAQQVIAAEEEQLVAQDRAANRAAGVVDAELPLGNALRVVRERVRVEPLVAQHVGAAPVERVRAGLGAHRDHGLPAPGTRR